MVRIKERYLLVNILYPSELGSRPHLPDVVLLNQPTTPDLTPQLLRRAIIAQVAALFGDYGSGALEGGNLQGKPTHSPSLPTPLRALTLFCSEISLPGNIDLDITNCTRVLPICLDSSDFHGFRARQGRQALRIPSGQDQWYHAQSRGGGDPSR
ncbi:hypothetical protein F5Y18DRAFT_44239 [Xylariaceae sp. FL1019]|nr:hypothetical protein F5Y18DRAFT_44239 [Xylariaceae sp. FL1019]